ncbi:hypothetical protein K503DRAFT_857701 [Rhizopogon vinicolor AM-OR11-026]|uniref:Uncharacterized protein n=1 Tax=Rhizopogon vinicolor AM-OR11-026 TaxID=1314800 RepID=A0A1B7MWE3_9AGAM|nr:hypothetical protein K503DRAFT_857701 [Rhizopogon vinicolor AM-OR11-026]
MTSSAQEDSLSVAPGKQKLSSALTGVQPRPFPASASRDGPMGRSVESSYHPLLPVGCREVTGSHLVLRNLDSMEYLQGTLCKRAKVLDSILHAKCEGLQQHPKYSNTELNRADAVPRWILLDSAFIRALKSYLGGKQSHNPALSDLYSRRNFDHARRLTNTSRFARFPSRIGFEDILSCTVVTTCTIGVDSEILRVGWPGVNFKPIAVTDAEVAAAAPKDVSTTPSPSAQDSARCTRPFQTHVMPLLVLPGVMAVPPHILPT